MEIPALTMEMITVFSVLGVVIVLLVFDILRVDVVGLLVMTSLPLVGLLTPREAIAGLGSNAVVVLICVMVIGASLNKTGVVAKIAQKIVKLAGKSQSRVVALLGISSAVPSAFMSNVGIAALMLPAVLQVSRVSMIPASKLVMPMGFCANMGGNLSLVGSTPLIILNDVMSDWWQAHPTLGEEGFVPLGLFYITPIGIAMVIGAVAYFLLIGCKLLPERKGKEEGGIISARLRELYSGEVGKGAECVVPDDFPAQTLGQLDIRSKYKTTVVAVARSQQQDKIMAPRSSTLIGPGDVVILVCNEDSLRDVEKDLGWQPRDTYETFSSEAVPEKAGVLEAIVSSSSALNGHTMEELKFRKLFTINPLAVMRKGEVYVKELVDLVLKPGDAILLQGEWDNLRILQEKTDLIYTEQIRGQEIRSKKAPLALAALAVFLTLALVVKMTLSLAGLVTLMILVITKVMHIDEVYKAVEWKTIFLVAGLIPLGIAFEKTGAANYLAMNIMHQMGDLSTLSLYFILAVLTSFFGMFVSNVGITVLLVPLAMNMAFQVGADPKIAGLVVAIASINTFILPTHQVNALIMQPGGYKTADYMRVGSGFMVLFLVILMAMLAFFY